MRDVFATAIAALAAVVAVGALLTGCGGGGADQKANKAYASGVCTVIGSWLKEARSLSTVPSNGVTKDSLGAKLNQFETATKTFVSQIKAVPVPNTSQGKTAKRGIDQLATSARGASAAVQTAVASLPANASIMQMTSALTTVLPEFQTLKAPSTKMASEVGATQPRTTCSVHLGVAEGPKQ
jgi:hypothetical protein